MPAPAESEDVNVHTKHPLVGNGQFDFAVSPEVPEAPPEVEEETMLIRTFGYTEDFSFSNGYAHEAATPLAGVKVTVNGSAVTVSDSAGYAALSSSAIDPTALITVKAEKEGYYTSESTRCFTGGGVMNLYLAARLPDRLYISDAIMKRDGDIARDLFSTGSSHGVSISETNDQHYTVTVDWNESVESSRRLYITNENESPLVPVPVSGQFDLNLADCFQPEEQLYIKAAAVSETGLEMTEKRPLYVKLFKFMPKLVLPPVSTDLGGGFVRQPDASPLAFTGAEPSHALYENIFADSRAVTTREFSTPVIYYTANDGQGSGRVLVTWLADSTVSTENFCPTAPVLHYAMYNGSVWTEGTVETGGEIPEAAVPSCGDTIQIIWKSEGGVLYRSYGDDFASKQTLISGVTGWASDGVYIATISSGGLLKVWEGGSQQYSLQTDAPNAVPTLPFEGMGSTAVIWNQDGGLWYADSLNAYGFAKQLSDQPGSRVSAVMDSLQPLLVSYETDGQQENLCILRGDKLEGVDLTVSSVGDRRRRREPPRRKLESGSDFDHGVLR